MPSSRKARVSTESPVVVMTRGHSGSRVLMRLLELLGYRMGSPAEKPSGDVIFPRLKRTIMTLARRSLGRPPQAAPPPQEVSDLKRACDSYHRWLGAPARWGWKLPETYLVGGHVAAALPGAKLVELVRDGRDIAFKWHRTDRLDQRLGRRLLGEIDAEDRPHHIQAALSWAFQVERFERLRQTMPERVLTLRFEDLCRSPLEAAARLCAFLDVELPEAGKSYLASEIDPRVVGSFRSEPHDRVAEVEEAIGETLAHHGYELGRQTSDPRASGGEKTGAGLLLTGATGCLGGAILRRLLEGSDRGPIYLLLRDQSGAPATERFDRLVNAFSQGGQEPAAAERLRLIQGDLASSGLGLNADARDRLRADVEQIVHLGESSRAGASDQERYAVNVGGAQAILELARELAGKGRLGRLDFRSSAYVAGTLPGIATEDDLDRGQEFANSYERSKYEAERSVRALMGELPIVIYRPSTLPDRRTRRLLPLVLFSRNLTGMLRPGRDAWIDLLPVERAAEAMVALMASEESVGGCYHIVAGREGDIRVRDLLRKMPAPRDHLASYAIYDRVNRTTLSRFFPSRNVEAKNRADCHRDYLRGRAVRFDASRTRRMLAALGVELTSAR